VQLASRSRESVDGVVVEQRREDIIAGDEIETATIASTRQ
jgi:hypothetical protein